MQREFDQLLSNAGSRTSNINDALVAALDACSKDDMAQAREDILRAARLNSEVGDVHLVALRKWGERTLAPDAPAAPQPVAITRELAEKCVFDVQRTQLRPGTKVADAGGDTGDEYTGPVDPKLMSLGNWSFYQRANLGAKASAIFNGPFVIGDPARPGHLWAQGDLTTARPVAEIAGTPYTLAKWA
jgi:hypothetical protein